MASHAHKENPSLSPEEQKKRSDNVKFIIHTMRLEGIELDQDTLNEFKAFERGEISSDECLKTGIQRLLKLQKEINAKKRH